MTRALACTVLLALFGGTPKADEIRVAVASNFKHTATELADRFEVQTGHSVTLIFGATGKHIAQIKHGAPYDVLLAADTRSAALLDREGIAQPGTRFTYAVGKLVLWSPRAEYVDPDGDILSVGDYRFLAVANPKLAPYGRAAEQVLRALGLWGSLRGRIVRGENIAQAYQFVVSGNAELGFVASAQVHHPAHPTTGSIWNVPQSLYDPIEQQAVLLTDNQVAADFLSFVRSDEALEIIQDFGYGAP